MYIFTLKPTSKSVKWFKDNNYDLKAMGAALSMIFADVEPGTIARKVVLTVQVDFGADESGFRFYTDKIYLCDVPCTYAKSQKQKELAVFSHLLHEFRHCMQNRLYNIKSILVEGGASIIQEVLEKGLVSQLIMAIKPSFLGGFRSLTKQLPEMVSLNNITTTLIEGDIVVHGFIKTNLCESTDL
jgi:riboflavin biosynthesis pyrimidine reductase